MNGPLPVPNFRRRLPLRFFFALFVADAVLLQPGWSDSLTPPIVGFYNGFLEQQNVLECENSTDEALALRLSLRSNEGESVAETQFTIDAFGSKHVILSSLASLRDSYGTFLLERVSADDDPFAHLSCRTAFYRFAGAGAAKAFEFAYALPLGNSRYGSLAGIYNSLNPSGEASPTYNWLSIVNPEPTPFSGRVEIYDPGGERQSTVTISPLAQFARVDIALGHPNGQISGVYVITPDNDAAPYLTFLMRYGSRSDASFSFAFPLSPLPGSCAGESVQVSTMGNGFTYNWLELANVGADSVTTTLRVRARSGELLSEESRTIGRFGQSHFYVNPVIDATAQGNVGSASVECASTTSPIILQSSYYGRLPGNMAVEWAYASQAGVSPVAENDTQLTVPINTFFGMANWLKLAHRSGNTNLTLPYTVLNPAGTALAAGNVSLLRSGTSDTDLHTPSGANVIGTAIVELESDNSTLTGEVLRVLPRSDGEIGLIMSIPAAVEPQTDVPEPPPPSPPGTGYFPSDSVWYRDITNAAVDSESPSIINWLESVGGWGTGVMRIDYSIEVLEGDSATPFVPFTATEDFYEPDCDFAQVPLPPGGALEGEQGYACESDGDCHLIVRHRPTNKLYEMWRGNLVGSTLFGGCLAVWDLSRNYSARGRGQDCTSADAAGLPIAPLLFTADEVSAGEIAHAIRFTLPNNRIRNRTYVHPGTHATGAASGGATAPPYGALFRLRADFPLGSLPNEAARVVARGLQRYGMFLADGGTIALTAQSDSRTTAKWDGLLDTRDLQSIRVSDFEMIEGGERFTFTGDCVREPL